MSGARSSSVQPLYPAPEAPVRAAEIVAVTDPTRVRVRDEDGWTGAAVLALASPYLPAEGDRVVVAGGRGVLYVIGVIQAANPPSLPIPGGGAVRVEGEAVEVRDAEGRLLVRCREGSAEIAAPGGDLTLTAPAGRVVIRSALDVSIEATRDLHQHAGRSVEVGAGTDSGAPQIRVGAETTSVAARRLEVKTGEATVETDRASVVAREIVTAAVAIRQKVERFELEAVRLVEKTRDAIRDASGIVQLRAGRVRTLVEGAYSHYARTTAIVSSEDTTIDGERIHLG